MTSSVNSLAKTFYLCIIFYKDIGKLRFPQFKRMTGVKRKNFEQMLEVLNETKAGLRKYPSRGTPPKLSNADKLLHFLTSSIRPLNYFYLLKLSNSVFISRCLLVRNRSLV
jgi:hypothetical protein